jgi:hypothetical protein
MSSFKNSPDNHPSLPAKPAGPLPPKSAIPGSGRGYGSGAGPAQSNHATTANPYSRPVAAPFTSGYQQSYSPTVTAAPVSNAYQSYQATVSAPPAPPSYAQPSTGGYGPTNYQQPYQQQAYQQQAPTSYYSQAGYASYPTATSLPQIQNPFAPPTQGAGAGSGKANGAYDPEWEAQAAQWNQNYVKSEETTASKGGFGKKEMGNANMTALGQRGGAGAQLSNQEIAAVAPGNSRAAAVIAGSDGKQKTVVRSGGGKTWQDSTLLEWDPAHPRIFVGNLAGEVTDESLYKAFSNYSSVQKARVVRDSRTTKSKGYGFVSFSNSDDYFRAAKEMQGKYIGSHPVQIKRSTTEIKATKPPPKNGKGGKHGNNKHGKGGSGGGGDGYTGGAGTGAGVKKNKKNTVNGLKLLG